MFALRRLVCPSTPSVGRIGSALGNNCSKPFSSLVPAVANVDLVQIAEVIKPSYSAVRHPYSINGLPLSPSPALPQDLFAVIELSGTQHKVTVNDIIISDKMDGIDIGQILDLKKVLLVGSRKATVVGRPYVEGAQVIVAVEEMSKDKKVITFKMRRRKNSRSLRGYRREITVLRVVDILFGDEMVKESIPEIF